MTDHEICEAVSTAIEHHTPDEKNWSDSVRRAMSRPSGPGLHADQPDGSDAWEIVRLADGRIVYLADESAKGATRFRITH